MIKRRIFKFLWFGHKEKEGFHLVKLERLVKPNKLGGWANNFFFQFGSTLVTRSLWRGHFTPSMWHKVNKVKYLKNRDVVDWIRGYKKNGKGFSNCWNCFLTSYSVLNDWLA